MFESKPYQLYNTVQNYSWGTKNENAFIPKLLGVEPKLNVPYAELWMGNHPNAPSKIRSGDNFIPLDEFIEKHPAEILGKRVNQKFSSTLPFLFKILSAGEALSIQTHPNREQAGILHSQDSQNYPDANHKPEIAIAIDSLTALIGFKPLTRIRDILNKYPALEKFVGGNTAGNGIKKMFTTLVENFDAESTASREMIDALLKQINEETDIYHLSEEEIYFSELFKKYGYDVGLPAIFFLNLIRLNSGEALFTPAGVPHAYLKGNIIECMANSDNVLRLGLTPKFKDVKNILKVLDFKEGEIPFVEPAVDGCKKIYQTLPDEFAVAKIKLSEDESVMIDDFNSPAILLVMEGNGALRNGDINTTIKKGQSFLLPASIKNFEITALNNCEMFAAYVPQLPVPDNFNLFCVEDCKPIY